MHVSMIWSLLSRRTCLLTDLLFGSVEWFRGDGGGGGSGGLLELGSLILEPDFHLQFADGQLAGERRPALIGEVA